MCCEEKVGRRAVCCEEKLGRRAVCCEDKVGLSHNSEIQQSV